MSEILQEWIGIVHEVGKKTFGAMVRDQTDNTDEWMDIPISLVNESDRDEFGPGAEFYFRVVHKDNEDNEDDCRCEVEVIRHGRWTEEQIEHARKAAKLLHKRLTVHGKELKMIDLILMIENLKSTMFGLKMKVEGLEEQVQNMQDNLDTRSPGEIFVGGEE